ncbi:chromosome segregation protein SMC [Halochromatium salexigens]|uniref:Chromosome partition protein Smc n=1 Tax=Halochromatium salexigens TaxID=49447 RepID=A0AAJ0UFH6_HALSE|nr:chromosome segregation protein SMC [Halochromatium salexigens]MBK5930498.1 chromosome segregation protein SMC [Halochromatium salexigens]
MRLEKIKLAGFKSFVDPTTVPFPSNRVGVVGPNGCGKSNVIDAVRWVMGESSAKMLRGQSMADVIFNGSSSRKPVGLAHIELVFDNSDGRAGGEFARFAQIAVKRQVSRDGQSSYFLNGARCRRRDIQDLFLGTGLGPRSYAIIEQGMISRFIEAKPDELRLFIEEAAGISKYKERRRETENRMRHTRENLERLQDLRDEVSKQLQHLERQAKAATHYRALKEDERRLTDERDALRWRELDQALAHQDREIGAAETRLEADQAALRQLEAEIESARAEHAEASEAFNAVQGRWYAVGSEIARLEQALQFASETRQRQERELGAVRRELDEASDQLRRDQQRQTELDAELERDTPVLEESRERLDDLREQLAEAEDQLDTWQQAWDEVQLELAGPAAEAQHERSTLNQLEQRLAQDRQRSARIDDEDGRLDTAELEQRLAALDERSEGLDERLSLAADAQARAAADLREAESARRELAGRLDAARTELQTTRGRLASLEALQDAALENPDAAVAAWIDRYDLTRAPRLLDLIEVTPGWESAVEVVLNRALAAVCVDELDALADALDSEALMLVEHAATQTDGIDAAPAGLVGLGALVRGPAVLTHWLDRVAVAESREQALASRSRLDTGECIVTRDGFLVGPGWVRAPGQSLKDGADVGGSIARAEEMRALQAAAEELDEVIAALAEEQEALAARRGELEQARDEAHADLARLSRDRAALDAEQGAARARLNHLRERRAALAEEQAELQARHAEIEDAMAQGRECLHAALEQTEQLTDRRDALAAERESRRSAVTELRGEETHWRDQVQRLEVATERQHASRAALLANLERAGERLASLEARRDELAEALHEAAEPALEQQERLDEQLEQRVQVEQALNQSRTRMEAIDTRIRAAEQRRHGLEQALNNARQALDAARLQRQELLVRRQTVEEQLRARETSAQAVLAAMDAGAMDADVLDLDAMNPTARTNAEPASAESAGADQLARCESELEAVKARIARLGNINLAAIDEFQEQSERMRYLEAQHADISSALETLEAAIRKIDRETRSRFKETFDRINSGLQELFPRVFGGGHASLELTGEDLLDTGVSIMARPPGKRNATIHMLSGGEKALTAVALVFAIFQLNPAPFCMLDEVDAPLDDANVGRFCELVRSMSDQIQFIFITHNKVTMELADQLLGITMHEPGVSRLVSVDVEQAARMVAAS